MNDELLMKVVEALLDGITPEELLKQGVPQEIILKATQLIEQQNQSSLQENGETQMGVGGI